MTIKREFVIITISIEVMRIVTVRQAKPEFMAEGLSLWFWLFLCNRKGIIWEKL